MYDDVLGEAFHFTPDDLAANRTGLLSSAQSNRYSEANTGCLRGSVLSTLVLGAASAAVFFLTSLNEAVTYILLTLTGISFLGLLLAWFTRNDKYYLHDIDGEARLSVDMGSNNSKRMVMNIKGYTFTLDPNQYNLIEDGKAYHVYFTSLSPDEAAQKTISKLIQSIEAS